MTDFAEEKAIAVAKEASKLPYDRSDCERALKNVRKEKVALERMLETVYPPGIRVIAELGGHRVKVEITAHWHAGQGELRGFNVKTGAVRKFHFSAIQEIVI